MREFLSRRFYYTFGPHDPAISIASGTELCVICPDSDNVLSDGSLLRADQRQQGPGLFEGNPMAGPVHVDGAEPGDAIAITILDVELDRPTGQTGLAPGHGLLPIHLLSRAPAEQQADNIPRHLYRWSIDAKKGVARLLNPLGRRDLTVKLNPFVGCIGVCPSWGQQISTLFAGGFGGNMDLPAVRAGATLMLPVFHSGGLLMMGDIHAAQGHGEIIGGAIETSGKIRCRIDVIKGARLSSPCIRDATTLYAVTSDGDLRSAVQQAYADLLDLLETPPYELHRFDAYNLVSQTGGVMIGNLVTSPYSVAAYLPLDAVDANV